MNGIDRIANNREVLWTLVLDEFRIYMDSQRTEQIPDTMEVAIMKWQQELGLKALSKAAHNGGC